MPQSFRSAKCEVRPSPIHGRGLFAARPIRRGEVVAVKGGHVFDRRALRAAPGRRAVSYVQIGDGRYIGTLHLPDVARNKIFINHSCEPNVGIRGEITFVALRDVRRTEELAYDWAMEEDEPARTRCRCGARRCRSILTGRDWRIPALQRRYRGWFSAHLADKIARTRPPRRVRGRPRRASKRGKR